MSYLVLARKWRPQSFDDLVGQEHVSRTLGNAIAQDRVAHAFLFTGARGVGKTTSARILAKALNCLSSDGPTASPCLVCAACKEIAAGVDVDVQEIDGASHTGVDDVRRIQESLPYRPARDRHKILIVDEVHMLSGNAWNAFLKTLEEPPAHVKFIFATTEVHKVPITILSRCQRFDFKMISAQRIAERVRYILGEEKIVADEAAVQLVAREAAGSMRDALSILDQCIAFGGASLVGDEVARVLGVADRAALHALASAVVEGHADQALSQIDALARGGFDLGHVARDLLRRFRDLAVARVVPEPEPLLDLADAELADVKTLAARTNPDDLARIFTGLSKMLDDIATAGTPRHTLEIACVRLARRPPLLPIDDLLARLESLERRLGPGGGGGGGGARPGGENPGGNRPPTRPMQGAAPSHAAPNHVAPNHVAPSTPAHASAPTPAAQPAPATMHASAQPSPATMHASAAPSVVPSRPSVVDVKPPSQNGPVDLGRASSGSIAVARAPVTEPPKAGGSAQVEPVSGAHVQPAHIREPATLARVRAIAQRVRATRSQWGTFFENGVVLRCDDQVIELAYGRRTFFAGQLADRAIADCFAEAARKELGLELRLLVVDGALEGLTLAKVLGDEKAAALGAARKAVVDHPLVQEAIAIFSAEVRTVKLAGEES
ncbi:MAG: DNA polymerase III subunit gamma/tau [Myxococcales bacterium]|nr:DNA polymerase III subunit gamma/tau [Myxococcales bacterium]